MRTARTSALALATLFTLSALAPAQSQEKSAMTRTIVQIAAEDGNFTTLVKALKAAGLVETLQGEGPFTVFAPTDAAFAKLPAGTLDVLLRDTEKLKAILTHHVLPGRVESKDITGPSSPATVNGDNLRVRPHNGGVFVNDARVVQADIHASNGVIHVIDAVLVPAAQPAPR